MALSDITIRNAKPQAKPYKISDSGGLFLLVTLTGGKLWRYSYRFDGKQKTLALGSYPDTVHDLIKFNYDQFNHAEHLY